VLAQAATEYDDAGAQAAHLVRRRYQRTTSSVGLNPIVVVIVLPAPTITERLIAAWLTRFRNPALGDRTLVGEIWPQYLHLLIP
jgi:hypothetical protein